MPGNGLVSRVRRLMDPEDRLGSPMIQSFFKFVLLLSSKSPFAHLRLRMTDVSGDGGILKEVVQSGAGPPVPHNASILTHYSGFLEYSDQPFETTTNRKYPRMMKLGRDFTLLGLELGLLTMKKGEFSRFLLKPEYAYGDMGCPPLIPAAAVVLYEIQILDFLDSGQVDEFIAMGREEQNAAPLDKLLDVVNTVRSSGNRCFKQSRFHHAKDRYKQAVKLLRNREELSGVEQERMRTALLPLYLNLSLTELRLESPHKALKYGNKALEIDGANTKALFRCGKAYLHLHEYESAQDCLTAAQANKPFDTDINNLLRTVATCYKDSLDKQKEVYSRMFGGLRSK